MLPTPPAGGRRGVQPRSSMQPSAACTGHVFLRRRSNGSPVARDRARLRRCKTPPPSRRVSALSTRVCATARTRTGAGSPRCGRVELLSQRGAASDRTARRSHSRCRRSGKTVASTIRLGTEAGVCTGEAGSMHVRLDGRRDEHIDAARLCARGWVRGKHSCPCPRTAAQRSLEKTRLFRRVVVGMANLDSAIAIRRNAPRAPDDTPLHVWLRILFSREYMR